MQARRNKRYPRNRIGGLCAGALLCAACTPSIPAANVRAQAPCDTAARLEVELFGGIRESVHWSAATLRCQSMPRPDGDGARLRLSGKVGEGEESRTLAFILGIPGLTAGETGTELPTNVTLIEEGAGRFFATQDTSGCWTDVERHERIRGEGAPEYRISGILYCVSPLAELNSSASVTLTDMHFASRINWESPE